MKKILKLLPLALMLVLCSVLLIGCGINKYKTNLENEGYTVEEWDDDEISEKLSDLEIELGDYGITNMLYAKKGSDTVYVVEFELEDSASDFASYIESKLGFFFEVEQNDKIVLFGSGDGIEIATK